MEHEENDAQSMALQCDMNTFSKQTNKELKRSCGKKHLHPDRDPGGLARIAHKGLLARLPENAPDLGLSRSDKKPRSQPLRALSCCPFRPESVTRSLNRRTPD